MPGDGKVTDHPLVQKLAGFADSGSATGEQLGSLSSKLGKAAVKQMTSPSGDRDLGRALYQVKDGVDDLVDQGLSPEQSAIYSQARGQYRALMQLTSRAGNLNSTTGDVNGANMASYLQRADKSGYLFNQNQSPAYAATRFAQAFKPSVSNSGTATRQLGFGDLWQIPYGVPLNLASRLYYRGLLPNPTGAARSAIQAVPGIAEASQE